MAPATGLEPVTYWLTANRSTIELRWNVKSNGEDSWKGQKVKPSSRKLLAGGDPVSGEDKDSRRAQG